MKIRCVSLIVTVLWSYSVGHAENWAQWRGPFFNGSTSETGLPDQWDKTDILWKTPLPGPSTGSPVVWEDRVFVITSVKDGEEVMAMGLDVKSGDILWQRPLGPDRSAPGNNTMAAPSPVTDGAYVWFLTGAGQCAAFTMDGKPIWQRDLAKAYGPFEVFFGYSASPLLYNNMLYIQVLQCDKPRTAEGKAMHDGPLESYLLALDPASGRTLWRHVRPSDATDQSRESYVTPLPYESNQRKEILLSGGECVTGHHPETGEELWRWWFTPKDREVLQHVVPTLVAGDGLIFAIRPEHRPLYAIRAGGEGELSDDYHVWTYQANRAWIASPLLYQGRLYVLQEEERTMLCMNPQTGDIIWEQKLPSSSTFQASPTGADNKVYCISMNGDVIVFAAGDTYQELAHVKLEDKSCRSTIAVSGQRLFIRTGSHLYCIGEG